MNWKTIIEQLESGEVRSAQKINGQWQAVIEVKQAILEAFRQGKMVEMPGGFVEKDTLPQRQFKLSDKIRFVPGGSAVRVGAYLAPGVVVLPPSYVNIGAYVDEGTMIDSHVLVGSCAQIGKNVHLSTAVQIGGVLEPVGLSPVIIEDGAFIGAGSIIVEGIQVGERAVIAPGVKLSKSIPVFDLVEERELPRGSSIPANAVVVPGTRPVTSSSWGKNLGLQIQCALIIKYRDEKSDASLVLEQALR